MILSASEAHALVRGAMEASATSPENAQAVADALVGAELVGQSGHGLRRVAAYAAQARSGKVDGFARPSLRRTRPGAVAIDAAHGFAFPAIALACAELPDLVLKQGIAIAGIAHSHHAGVPGLYVERLAERGLMALMVTNTPAAMPPWGGRRALFGTNPIAFGAPVTGGPPIVIDVSLSRVARGRVMAAAQKGEPIPEGWALDAEGYPTTDARAALSGLMLPAGDAKGAALALMVEILAAALTGARFAAEQTSFFDAEGAPPGTGHAIVAIDPYALGALRPMERIAEMAAAIEASEGGRIPGRRRQEMRARLELDGIPVDPALVEQIQRIGAT
jgi:(2R)-3-sulfolactate dehydrogenase (NADP+)